MPKSKKEDDSTKKSSVTKKSPSKKTATKTDTKKTATKTAAKKSAPKPEKSLTKKVEVSDDGFNWTEFEEGIQTISKKQIDEFDKLIDENFVDTYSESVIVGTVVNITEREAIIDINAKSEGVISLNEFRYNPELAVGDTVEVIVDIQEDKTGQLILSHRKARTIKAWERVIDAHDKETVVTGFVKCRTKGGMIVDVFGLEAFLPGSQIDVKPIRDYDQYVN